MSEPVQRFLQRFWTPTTRRLLNVFSAVLVLVVGLLVARHFAESGWPIHRANLRLVGLAAGLFLVSYGFKAFGWQRLFNRDSRPQVLTLAAAGGAAAVGGIALPGRIDDAVRVAIVRRYPGTKAGLGTIGVSLIVLGMLDNAALTPLASVAAADAGSWVTRVGFATIAVAGIAAAVVVAFLPKLAGHHRVTRFRVGRWLASHTHCTKEAWAAWMLISVSWALRGTAVFLLLNALSLKGSFPLALAFLCASAASAALPIAPAGAATQAGAGAAILIASGMHTPDAVAFSVAAQALVVVTGAAVIMLIAAWHLALRGHARFIRASAVA
jgi:hypothetical protein